MLAPCAFRCVALSFAHHANDSLQMDEPSMIWLKVALQTALR